MTNEELKDLIDGLNQNVKMDRFLLRPIGGNVEFAYVWEEDPSSTQGSYLSAVKFYFIRDNEGKYVGAVNVLENSISGKVCGLHLFTLEEHRRQGFMKNALQDHILPHLMRDGSVSLWTTTNDDYSTPDAKILLENVGFKDVGKHPKNSKITIYEFRRENLKNEFKEDGIHDRILSDEVLEQLKTMAMVANNLLTYVGECLSQAYGESGKIGQLSYDLCNAEELIDNVHWAKKNHSCHQQ